MLRPSRSSVDLSRYQWMLFCDLADGSFLAYKSDVRSRCPIVWVKDPQDFHGPCVAKGLDEFLRRALDSKGRLYFQEPEFTPSEHISLL